MARPRGFIHEWEPQPHVLLLIDRVAGLINRSTILPLTLRQIFYMMVSDYGYPKEEKSYKNLCETLNKARRAKMIDMDSIRDDGLQRKADTGWSSKKRFTNTVRSNMENFVLDRQADQETKVYVWCEAQGMVPQLHNAVREWHIPVLSSGGFDSVTTKHNLAKELAAHKNVVVLHLGDHDPSGVHMYGSLDEDLQAFMYEMRQEMGYDFENGACELHRIAVTPEQVESMGLPTSPPKAKDKRSFSGLTTQCEAIKPPVLREIVRDACLEYIDLDVLKTVQGLEKEISVDLMKKFGDLLR